MNGVLPFGNIVVTLPNANGAELKAMLENGVSLHAGRPTAGSRRCPGLCFT